MTTKSVRPALCAAAGCRKRPDYRMDVWVGERNTAAFAVCLPHVPTFLRFIEVHAESEGMPLPRVTQQAYISL